jgi:hypothetical protein
MSYLIRFSEDKENLKEGVFCIFTIYLVDNEYVNF